MGQVSAQFQLSRPADSQVIALHHRLRSNPVLSQVRLPGPRSPGVNHRRSDHQAARRGAVGQLDQTLGRRFPGAASAADFRARYLDAGTRLALPAPHPQPGQDRG